MEASTELQSKIEKTDNVEEAVFGEGEYVTSRSKGTVYRKDGSVLFNRKYVVHGPTKASHTFLFTHYINYVDKFTNNFQLIYGDN